MANIILLAAAATDGVSNDVVTIVGAATGIVAVAGASALSRNIRRAADRRLSSAEKTAAIIHSISDSTATTESTLDDNRASLEPASEPTNSTGRWEPITTPQDSSTRFIESIGQAAAKTSAAQADLYLEHQKRALALHSQYQQASLHVGIFGFLVILLGAVLTYVAGLDVGVLTAASGAIAEGAAALLFRQADKIDARATDLSSKLYLSVERSEALRQTLGVAAMITDEQTRNRIYATIALQGAITDSEAVELPPANTPAALPNSPRQ